MSNGLLKNFKQKKNVQNFQFRNILLKVLHTCVLIKLYCSYCIITNCRKKTKQKTYIKKHHIGTIEVLNWPFSFRLQVLCILPQWIIGSLLIPLQSNKNLAVQLIVEQKQAKAPAYCTGSRTWTDTSHHHH